MVQMELEIVKKTSFVVNFFPTTIGRRPIVTAIMEWCLIRSDLVFQLTSLVFQFVQGFDICSFPDMCGYRMFDDEHLEIGSYECDGGAECPGM